MELGRDRFLDDVGRSLAVWRKSPFLPAITAILAGGTAATAGPTHGNLAVLAAGLAVGLFYFGWVGTQFVWYQRAFEGQSVQAGEIFSLTWSFMARYVRLYLLGLVPVLLLVFVAVRWRTFAFESPGWRVGMLAYLLAFDVASAFVNPTLAFSTRKVFKAVPIGLQILAGSWRETWKYAVVPGVSAVALGGIYWVVPSPGRPEMVILIAVISLLFAGAIARYYLRNASTPALEAARTYE